MEEAVVNAIRCLLNGNFYFSEQVNNRIFLQCQGKTGATPSTPLTQLTDRELDVFEKYGRGLSTRQIAESLNISPKTVETHRGRIKEKMAYSNSTEMLKHAVHWVQEQCH
jgi:DNA-binding NarL/FixJ family response regulator